ncbi:hypothetical protein, partial [Phocaeicola coprocola]
FIAYYPHPKSCIYKLNSRYKKTIKFVTIKEEKNYLYPQKLAGILLFYPFKLKKDFNLQQTGSQQN